MIEIIDIQPDFVVGNLTFSVPKSTFMDPITGHTAVTDWTEHTFRCTWVIHSWDRALLGPCEVDTVAVAHVSTDAPDLIEFIADPERPFESCHEVPESLARALLISAEYEGEGPEHLDLWARLANEVEYEIGSRDPNDLNEYDVANDNYADVWSDAV